MKKLLFLLLFFTGIVQGQIVNIPNTLLKDALTNNACVDLNSDGIGDADADTDNDGEIQVSEAEAVNGLYLGILLSGSMTGLEAFINLQNLQLSFISFTGVLDFTVLPQLKTLDCAGTFASGINVTGLTQLETLVCNGCLLASLDVSTLTSLKRLNCEDNSLTTLDVTGLNSLEYLNCSHNNLLSLNVSNFAQLTQLLCNNNQLTNLNVQGCTALTSIDCYQNNLTNINFSGLTNLQTARIMTSAAFDQLLTSVNFSGCAALSNPQIYTSANMTALNFSGCAALTQISNSFSTIESIDLSGCSALKSLNIGRSNFTAIDLSSCIGLDNVSLQFNNLTALDLSGYTLLTSVDVSHGTLTSIDVTGCAALNDINIAFNALLPTLDVSTCTSLNQIIMVSTNLTSLYIKNGRNETISFSANPNLLYICADESQFGILQQQMQVFSPDVVINSYCTFLPGGSFNTITGSTPYDLLGDGCDLSDISNPYIKIRLNDGTNDESTFTNPSGNYSFYTQAGNFTLTPEFENPTYFNVTPVNAIMNFPLLDNSTQTQDFCISGNGVHPDLEIIIVPIDRARPGFDTKYKIIYKNKGNQVHSGSIDFTFDDSIADLTSATPTVDSQTVNHLLWNFSNLLPLETREINFVLNLNTPLETPPLVQGDVLHFIADIITVQTDETPGDNTFNCHETVINAHDPNHKICLEGNTITTSEVGKYLHYNINFENIGTADAVNIVVKDSINLAKLDINSLQLLYASHAVTTKIRGNSVEFIFQKINLPPSDIQPIGGHGNVLFKIKTVDTLVVGDEITNTGNIFFDYNAPIITNEAKTTIASLSNGAFIKDETIVIAPNPAKQSITVSAKNNIQSIGLFDAQGRLLQTVLEHKNTSILDLSKYSKGVYFVKINTEKGSAVQKIIKE